MNNKKTIFLIQIKIDQYEDSIFTIFVFKPLSGEKAELRGVVTPLEPIEVPTPYEHL